MEIRDSEMSLVFFYLVTIYDITPTSATAKPRATAMR